MNIALFYFLFNLSSTPIGATLAYFFATTFQYFILALIVVFFIIRFRPIFLSSRPFADTRQIIREACFVIFTTFGAWVVATLLKYVFQTDRPFVALHNITPLFNATGYSFPSGHATTFAALGCAIFILDRKWGIGFIAAAIVIALARVVVGVHYPQDILAGFIIGGALAFAGPYVFLKKTHPRR